MSGLSISQELERQSVVHMECTIPPEMTIKEWRRLRRVVPLRPESCDHLHETTTRYDAARKQLSFLMVCEVCGIEKVVETVPYEPRYRPHPPIESAGATVYEFPVRRRSEPIRRAA